VNKSGPIALTSNFAYGQRRSSLAAEGAAASGKALGEVARLSSDEALQRLSSSKNGLTPGGSLSDRSCSALAGAWWDFARARRW
jgi:Mg2+-importing ATPase